MNFFPNIAIVCLMAVIQPGQSSPRRATLGPSFAFDPHVIGGTPASPGEFPHQLSLHHTIDTRIHRCGAILLSATEALTTAHCLDGYNLEETYITAGLHARDDHEFAQTRHMAEFTMHLDWCNTCAGYPNDLAIIRWDDPLDLDLPNVGVARLPDNNDNDFAGETCVVSGWGRIDSTPNMANELIKADMSVIFTDECAARLDPLMGGPSVFSQHICVFNSAEDAAPCNGDNGGPLNCPLNDPEDDRTHFVAGISSWFISSAGDCLLETPSVYVRIAAFLDWIEENTSAVFYAKGLTF